MADSGKVEMDAICRMETHTKTCCVKIERYSLTKALYTEKSIVISMFCLAGVRWGIRFYTNGSWSSSKGHVSLHSAFPMVISARAGRVSAENAVARICVTSFSS